MKTIKLIFPLILLTMIVLACGESKPKEWSKFKPLTDKLDHPRALAADETSLYFVTGGTVASQKEGTNNLMKMPLSGGNPTILFKGGEIIPETGSIFLDDKFVYFSANGLQKIPKNGGDATLLAKTGMISEIVCDGENVYWMPFVGEGMKPAPIYFVSKNGGEAKTLTDPRPTMNGLSIDDKFVYWIQTDGIYKKAKNGGEIEKVYTPANNGQTTALKTDKENFYFKQGSSFQELYTLSKNGGEPRKITENVGDFWIGDGEIILLRYANSFDSKLSKINKDGKNETEIDQNGYLSDLFVGKNKIFLSDVIKIYELEK
ncbi:MAG TPA: DUF5050 domain-containing protein [Pyrinomonadaceae bacterium]|nr:DUF5050 domain-containing protein [Pyrinomonadaceae bacterium]